MTTVPILAYHSVADDPPEWIRPFAVAPAAFRRHLDLLAAEGATPLTVSEYVDALAARTTLPARPVVITFDDGLADFRDEAVPALTRRGFTATLYVTTGFLEGANHAGYFRPPGPWLEPAALVELHDQGVEIGGHTHTHPQLDTLSSDAVSREIGSCKEILEHLLQQPIRSFAYPHGFLSASVRRIVAGCGFESACAVKNALSSTRDDPLALARVVVRSDTPTSTIAAWLDGRGAPIAPRGEAVRTRAWRSYRRARSTIRRRAGYDWDSRA